MDVDRLDFWGWNEWNEAVERSGGRDDSNCFRAGWPLVPIQERWWESWVVSSRES